MVRPRRAGPIRPSDVSRRAHRGQTARRHRRHRRGAEREQTGRTRRADWLARVAQRPRERRPLPRRELVAGGDRRLPDHQRPVWRRLRAAARDLVHRHSLERADADQARVRLRGRQAGAQEAAVPADAPDRDARRSVADRRQSRGDTSRLHAQSRRQSGGRPALVAPGGLAGRQTPSARGGLNDRRWYKGSCGVFAQAVRPECGLRRLSPRAIPREPRGCRPRLARVLRARRRLRPPPPAPAPAAVPAEADDELVGAVAAATALVKAYRTHGHLNARLDPLGSDPMGDPALDESRLEPPLTPELQARIPAKLLRLYVPRDTLLEALPRLREVYAGTIAYEIEHISDHAERVWLRKAIET